MAYFLNNSVKNSFCKGQRDAGIVLLLLVFSPPLLAVNYWTNVAGGSWAGTNNWSTGRAPDTNSGLTLITNANTKEVVMDASTPLKNLAVNNLTLSGPPGTTNNLRLNEVGTNTPFRLLGGSGQSVLAMYRGAALALTNSSLVVTGNALVPFYVTMWGGSLSVESGSVVLRDEPPGTNNLVTFRLGRGDSTSRPSQVEEARLNIQGGTVDAGILYIGTSAGSAYSSQASVNMTGGALNIYSELAVGADAACTGAVWVAGGTLRVASGTTNVIRIGDNGLGFLTVSGGSVSLPTVSVGRHTNSLGVLTVQSNGLVVLADDLSIGRFSGATGMVTMLGGQLFATNQGIWVGREGVGQLTLSNGTVHAREVRVAPTNTAQGLVTVAGGELIVASNLLVGAAGLGTGQVAVAGGSLAVASGDGSAEANVAGGTLTLTAGLLAADNLVLTNGAGRFIFQAGTLNTKGTRIANGLPFVVGDGTNAATFQLTGGLHSFADGLIISSNAALTGCGTIVGAIINYGTIATNCSAPSILVPPADLTVPQGSDATFGVTAAGSEPPTYQWRFNSNNIPGAISSNLTIVSVQASNAGYYDVVVANSLNTVISPPALLRVLVAPVLVGSAFTTGNSFSFSFESVSGLRYSLEYKDAVDAPSWNPLTNMAGDGGLINIFDSPVTGGTRIYRAQVE